MITSHINKMILDYIKGYQGNKNTVLRRTLDAVVTSELRPE